MKGWLAAGTVGTGVLLRFPPARYGFYPQCPVFEAFGLLCPGCGATRAAAALLHGQLFEALRWNALFVVALFAALLCGLLRWRGGNWPEPRTWQIAVGLGVTILFAVGRNVV